MSKIIDKVERSDRAIMSRFFGRTDIAVPARALLIVLIGSFALAVTIAETQHGPTAWLGFVVALADLALIVRLGLFRRR